MDQNQKWSPELHKAMLSYAHEDRSIAVKLFEDLQGVGADISIDFNNLMGGESIFNWVCEELESVSCLILLWSRHASKSYFVGHELRAAFQREKRIIPCVLDQTPLPLLLCDTFYVDFSRYPDSDTEFIKLCLAIGIVIV